MPAPSISEAAILPCKERSRASICLLASRLLDAIPETYIGDNLSASQPRQTSGIVGRPYDACVPLPTLAERPQRCRSASSAYPPLRRGNARYRWFAQARDGPIRATHALVVARLVVGILSRKAGSPYKM